jgi:putative tryptophan/tyrosine transport system substrate-binding protein
MGLHSPGRRRLLQASLALAGLGFAAGCRVRLPWETPSKVARIGILQFNPPGQNGTGDQDFVGGLHDLGWVEGQNLAIEIRYGDSTYERLEALAAELVDLKPDLIFTGIGTAVAILTKATSTIPIVFGGIGVAPGAGSVQSLARPGNNATGTISLAEGLNQKRLELLKECVPTLSSVAALRHPSVGGQPWQDVQDAAAQLGLTFQAWDAPDVPGIEAAFASLKSRPVDGLVVISGATLFVERERIVRLAAQHHLPAVYPFVEYADAGGLLAYAANSPDLWRRAATHADKILRGANPAELPVERPTKFDLVVNLQTAQQLGVVVPHSALSQATRIIE